MIENDPKKIKDKIINKLISLRDQQTTQKESDTMSESMDETELLAMDIPEDLEKDAVIPELAVSLEKHISLPPMVIL